MPRRPHRKAQSSSDEGRFLASRIQDARRKGYSNRIIADSFGINERTVRKIVSGETSGKRLYAQHVAPSRAYTQNLSIVRLDLAIGKDAQGNDVIRSVNAKTTLVNGKTPTPFDVLRMPSLNAIAMAEADRMRRQYGGTNVLEPLDDEELDEMAGRAPRITAIRPIRRRDPSKRMVVIQGRT